MKTIIVSNENYSIIDLTVEYENWTGAERYAVVSDLEQSYIESAFASELENYAPYIFMSRSFLEVRREFRNNNKKYEMRSLRSESIFSFDEETEAHHEEIAAKDYVDDLIENIYLREALMCLTEKERQRVVAYYLRGKTYEEIGKDNGCTDSAIKKSVAKGIKKLSDFMKKY